MRVLFNAMQAGNQSGTGRYVEELLPALAALEDAPEFTVVWPEDVPLPAGSDRLEIRLQPRGLRHRLALERRLYTMAGQFDVVHYPATIGPLWRKPNLVITVHDCIFLHHPEWFRRERALYYRWAGAWSIGRAAHLIADSTHTARDLEAWLSPPPPNITTIPLGVSESFRPQGADAVERVRKRYQLPERFFLYVGTLEPRKNLARIVRAWDQVAATLPEDLVIAGRIGWKTGELEGAIAAATHQDRIHCPGFIESSDLPALLSAAHAFVWPSLYEGFGLPVLEAMACGTPVITANTTSLLEIADGAALTVDPRDEGALARALTQISTDGDLHRTLGTAGRKRADEFTWQRCAQETRAVYATVANARI